eukprot:11217174-Heterocapsa_arctica.AAC.1
MIEVASDRHTRKQTRDGIIDIISRIDRWFCNLLLSDLESRGASSTELGKLADPDSLSDHISIILMIGAKRKSTKKRGVPKWIASHSLYPQCFHDMNM